MTSPHVGFQGPPALIAAELRGYRRFRLNAAKLYPTVHSAAGPWSGQLQPAKCLAGGAHSAPDPGCGCGLYGWYHPADARADCGFGNVIAVIAGRGRIVLGDSGFRAQAARIEALAVPRLHVRGRGHLRQALAEHYPHAALYQSRRQMLRAHPPNDLNALGITVRPSPASRYRTAAYLTWLAGVLALYAVAVLPRKAVTDVPPVLWLGALAGFLVWQASLVALVIRSSPVVHLGNSPTARTVPQALIQRYGRGNL